MAFTKADGIIGLIKQQLGLDEKTYAVMQIWQKELGHSAKYAELAAIKRGVLIVEVESSVQLHEMTLKARSLVRTINQYFGGEKVVKGIKIKIKGSE